MDPQFDTVYEDRWGAMSMQFWTPVAVAQLAAEWLTETGIEAVADVGSGVGKFCLVGAQMTGAAFVGIEHRLPLVSAARRAAGALGLADRAHFVHGEVTSAFLSEF